jgi:hypothetical protein
VPALSTAGGGSGEGERGVTPAETLRALYALCPSLPPGFKVTLPLDWLSQAADGTAAQPAPSATSLPPADFTTADLASRYGRSKATCRGWVEAGRFLGAYRMHGSREWRVPQSGVEAFDATERQRGDQGAGAKAGTARPRGRPVNLGAWRIEPTAS